VLAVEIWLVIAMAGAVQSLKQARSDLTQSSVTDVSYNQLEVALSNRFNSFYFVSQSNCGEIHICTQLTFLFLTRPYRSHISMVLEFRKSTLP